MHCCIGFYHCLVVAVAFGIPSIARERQSYLLGTLRSLLHGLSEEDKADVVLVVFIGDVSILFIFQMFALFPYIHLIYLIMSIV